MKSIFQKLMKEAADMAEFMWLPSTAEYTYRGLLELRSSAFSARQLIKRLMTAPIFIKKASLRDFQAYSSMIKSRQQKAS